MGDIDNTFEAGGGTGGKTQGRIYALICTGAGHTDAAGRLCVDAATLALGGGRLNAVVLPSGLARCCGFVNDASRDGFAQCGLINLRLTCKHRDPQALAQQGGALQAFLRCHYHRLGLIMHGKDVG